MEIVLIIFSAVSAISIAVIAVLVLQIQKNLNASTTEQENLIQLVEVVNELSQQIGEINTKQDTKETEFSQLLNTQVESLIAGTSNLENRLVQFLEANNNQPQNPENLALNTHLEKLEVLSEKLAGWETVKTQVENLVKATANLDNRLTQLLEANKPKGKSNRKATSVIG